LPGGVEPERDDNPGEQVGDHPPGSAHAQPGG
jgi:hypothetical protein